MASVLSEWEITIEWDAKPALDRIAALQMWWHKFIGHEAELTFEDWPGLGTTLPCYGHQDHPCGHSCSDHYVLGSDRCHCGCPSFMAPITLRTKRCSCGKRWLL